MASVVVEQVYKRFELRHDRADSVGHLLWKMVPGRPKPPKEEFWALKDVSFTVPEGTSFGIVGNNGSGKSTLLKLLTRTMRPTQGAIAVRGRTSALIELGAGFHPDFTGRENVVLNASILGIPRQAIEKKMDAIIDFAEIRPFIDTPVKYYSSGMHARLGFSVATSVDPELLIVDEVLAVGDEAFQQKCMDRIFTMKRSGVNILLVSHSLESIERLMDQAIWIQQGVVRAIGAPREVIHGYRQFLLGQAEQSSGKEAAVTQSKLSGLELQSAGLSVHGKTTTAVASGDEVTIHLAWDNANAAFTGHLELILRRNDGLEIAEVSSLRDGVPVSFPAGASTLAVEWDPLRLTSGEYLIDARVRDLQGRPLLEVQPLLSFKVQALEKTSALLVMGHRWRVG